MQERCRRTGTSASRPILGQPRGNHRRRPHIARFLATCQLILRRGTPRTGWDPGTPKISSTPLTRPGPPLHPGRPDPARLLRPASPRTHEVANASHCPLCPRSGPRFPELGRTGRANRTRNPIDLATGRPGECRRGEPKRLLRRSSARPREVMGRPNPPSCLADASQTGDFRPTLWAASDGPSAPVGPADRGRTVRPNRPLRPDFGGNRGGSAATSCAPYSIPLTSVSGT